MMDDLRRIVDTDDPAKQRDPVTISRRQLAALLDVAEAAPAAIRLLETAQRDGLPSCRESISWENEDQHDAMCHVRKAASSLAAALDRLEEVRP